MHPLCRKAVDENRIISEIPEIHYQMPRVYSIRNVSYEAPVLDRSRSFVAKRIFMLFSPSIQAVFQAPERIWIATRHFGNPDASIGLQSTIGMFFRIFGKEIRAVKPR
jgi:hypothetical protein